jgi:hypothetical protein
MPNVGVWALEIKPASISQAEFFSPKKDVSGTRIGGLTSCVNFNLFLPPNGCRPLFRALESLLNLFSLIIDP